MARWVPGSSTTFSALLNKTPTLYKGPICGHGRAAPSWSLLVNPALDAAWQQSKGKPGAAVPEQLSLGQGRQLRDPGAGPLDAADVTSPCLPLVSSEAGYGLTFQKPQRSAGDCSWKLALKWWFPAPVFRSAVGMMTGMHQSCRGGADPLDHTLYPKSPVWQMGFLPQYEAAGCKEGPGTVSPCWDKSIEHHHSQVSQAPLSARH